MYCSFCFVDDAQIVVIDANFACLLKVNPDVAVYFFLLNPYIVGKRLSKEENNSLSNLSKRTVFADFSEIVKKYNIKSGFFFNLTNSSFLLVFTFLNVSLRKAPVSAAVVFYKQDFSVLLCLVKNNRTAGFFIKTAD